MHNPTTVHMNVGKQILQYIKRTLSCGLHLYKSTFSRLLSYTVLIGVDVLILEDILLATVFLGDNLISWSSKRQPILSKSSAENEYLWYANVVLESYWIRNP